MNLLFAINHNFTELLCGCLTSVLKNGGFDHYSVYILHSDLTGEDQMSDKHSTFQKSTIENRFTNLTIHFCNGSGGLFEIIGGVGISLAKLRREIFQIGQINIYQSIQMP